MKFVSVSLLVGYLLGNTLTSYAAQQGFPGTTSQGDIEIILALGNAARISGLDDFYLNINSAALDFSASQAICIGLLNNSQTYSIRAIGQGQFGSHQAFNLQNQGNDSIPFKVFFKDKSNDVKMELIAGERLSNLSIGSSASDEFNAYVNLIDCLYHNAVLEIQITSSTLANATVGTYTGSLTLTLVPE